MSPAVRRSLAGAVWEVAEADPDRQELWSRELALPPVAVQVLLNRGIQEIEEARRFLSAGAEDIHEPSLMAGMDEAAARVQRAVDNGEKIRLYGDYDADGVTSTALLLSFLRGLGADVDFYIPSRLEEGYGLNQTALVEAHGQGVRLVVSVDCGVTSIEEARLAADIGLDLVITDHHEPLPELPRAVAVVDPKRPDCPYPFKGLAGVGVAYKLAAAVARRYGRPDPGDYLDLVTLGTVADVVPLLGENRAIVKAGLPLIRQGGRLGLRALIDVAGLGVRPITAETVAYGMAPRINAVGRIGDAAEAVALLLSEDWADACARAARLDAENRSRQTIEGTILEEARRRLEADPGSAEAPAIVLSSSEWHVGVVGIVASRLAELYHRPVALLTEQPDGQARGSARSIPGINIFEALKACSTTLARFGGHESAAGLTLPTAGLEAFRQALIEAVSRLGEGRDLRPRVDVDADLTIAAVDQALTQALGRFAPFGAGNPAPLLVARSVEVVEPRCVGHDSSHLRMRVRQERRVLEAIGFSLGPAIDDARLGPVDILFSPSIDEWNGRERLQLVVRGLRPSEGATEDGRMTAFAAPAAGDAFAAPAAGDPVPGRGQAAAAQEQPPEALPVITAVGDGRALAAVGRLDALTRLLSRVDSAVIAVNNPWTAGSLEGRLAASGDGLARRRYRVGAAAAEPGRVPNGEAPHPAREPFSPATDGSGRGALVLYHPPISPGHLAGLLAGLGGLGTGEAEVLLLYGPAEVRLTEVILARQAPEREALVDLYRTLRETAPYGTRMPLRRLVHLAPAPWDRARHLVGLAIFEELGLLERIMTADGESLILSKPVPGARLDLESSPTFRRGRVARETFATYGAVTLSAGPAELLGPVSRLKPPGPGPEERGAIG